MNIRTRTQTYLVLFTFSLAGFLSSCSTSELRVESNPAGAEVIVIDSSKSPKKMGVTPLVLNRENTPQLFTHAIQVNLSRDGYKSESVFVPETSMNAQGQLVVQLNREEATLVNSTSAAVAEIQRLVFKKKYPEAERMLQDTLVKSPSVAVLHSLLGNVYYLEKNISRALDSYRRAQALDPSNGEVEKLIQKLKGMSPNDSDRERQ